MEDEDEEIDFENLIELFNTSYLDNDDSEEESKTISKERSTKIYQKM